MANQLSTCPECGREAIAFRAHLRGVRDVDHFPCKHCRTILRRSSVAWVPVIFALGTILVSASLVVDWIGAELENRWLLLPVFLGYVAAVSALLVLSSFVNWRFVALRKVAVPPSEQGA